MTIVVPPGFWEFMLEVSKQQEMVLPSEPAQRNSKNGRSDKVPIPKQKRTVSKYQKAFGKNLKMLKKKHPRTDISILMKKAHRLTRKELK